MYVKFDQVVPVQFEADFRENTLKCTAAYVRSSDGSTYGSIVCRQWSKATVDKLNDLRESMSKDILNHVLKDTVVASAPEGGSVVAQDDNQVGLEGYFRKR